MEAGDLYVRIDPARRDRRRTVALRWVAAPASSADSTTLTITLDGPPDLIALLDQRHPGQPPDPPQRLLLDVRAPDLFDVDWESALRPAFPLLHVTRFRDESDDRLFTPQAHPARVLFNVMPGSGEPDISALQYYKVHRLSGLDSDEVLATVKATPLEIVHLCVFVHQDPARGPILCAGAALGPSARGLQPEMLASNLRSCRARLLILQAMDEPAYRRALDTAHGVQRLGGPTTLVVESGSTLPFDAFYLDVVHNQDIDAASRGPGFARQALFSRVGGAQVLRISSLAEEFARRQETNAETLSQLERVVPRPARPPLEIVVGSGEDTDPRSRIFDLQLKLQQSAQIARDYAHESGAWTPLDRDLQEQRDMFSQVQSLERSLARVVNVGLFDGAEPLPEDAALRPSERYELRVQIGRAATWSRVENAEPIDESRLQRLYERDGAHLRVHVFAKGFEIDAADRELLLPPPPAESQAVAFVLRAPATAGRYRIRVGIYHQNNLLQSVLIRVRVGGAERGRAVSAEVEFALSATLTDTERLPERSLNILTNAGDDGGHTLVIVRDGPGPPVSQQFDFSDEEMGDPVDDARNALFQIAADASKTPPKYRFDQKNATDLARLEQDLVLLAGLGFELYARIVTARDQKFEKDLAAALGPAGARIQISQTGSAEYVFPWTLVYDHEYLSGRQQLCPDFKADWRNGQPMIWAQQSCLAKGCRHRADPFVVCPSGFWGFKHHIEQPLSVAAASKDKGARDTVLEMNGGPAGIAMKALMAVSRELSQVGTHERELENVKAFDFEIKDTKAEVWTGMQNAAASALHLIYFYCHGGRKGGRVWLGVGKGESERISPAELLRIDWSGLNPLVFINGCHTVDLTADDVLHFNRMFARSRAAGLIGTEISVPEELARDFACGFLAAFATGRRVGEVMRERRLALLEKGNLLGLAYTPYCSADLHVVRQ